jgi:cytosine deaminase
MCSTKGLTMAPESFDLVIRNAKLREHNGSQVDIGIEEGLICQIAPSLEARGNIEVDAGGNLVTESFVNPHLHLCKVYTLQMIGEGALKDYHGSSMGKAMSAIEQASQIKTSYEEDWIVEHARHAVALSALHGGTHIRAFADVDTKAKLVGVKALLRVREEFQDVVNLQVVAFPQDGLLRDPGAADLVREAMELGADVVGGIPWIEYTEDDMQEHVRESFVIAEEFDADVSMLVDDAGDPGLRTLEMLAVEAIRRGWQGRVLAHHARAMQLYPKPYFQKIAALLKRAKMGVISDPHTGPLHANVRELIEEGCLVGLGQDDISDAYYPYGRNSMLEVAFLASHLLWMTTRKEMELLYDMITTNAAGCIGLADFKIEIGAPANLVVLDVPNILEALRNHHEPDHVISHGGLVDREWMRQIVNARIW